MIAKNSIRKLRGVLSLYGLQGRDADNIIRAFSREMMGEDCSEVIFETNKEHTVKTQTEEEIATEYEKEYGIKIDTITSRNWKGRLVWDEDKINSILKPCPCCKGKGILNTLQDYKTDEISYSVVCEKCWLETPDDKNPLEAVRNWNRRD